MAINIHDGNFLVNWYRSYFRDQIFKVQRLLWTYTKHLRHQFWQKKIEALYECCLAGTAFRIRVNER